MQLEVLAAPVTRGGIWPWRCATCLSSPCTDSIQCHPGNRLPRQHQASQARARSHLLLGRRIFLVVCSSAVGSILALGRPLGWPATRRLQTGAVVKLFRVVFLLVASCAAIRDTWRVKVRGKAYCHVQSAAVGFLLYSSLFCWVPDRAVSSSSVLPVSTNSPAGLIGRANRS
jgi:hypothetical protein